LGKKKKKRKREGTNAFALLQKRRLECRSEGKRRKKHPRDLGREKRGSIFNQQAKKDSLIGKAKKQEFLFRGKKKGGRKERL